MRAQCPMKGYHQVWSLKILSDEFPMEVKTFLNLLNVIKLEPIMIIFKSCNPNWYKYYFFVRIIKMWNNLPKDVECAGLLTLFRNRLRFV